VQSKAKNEQKENFEKQIQAVDEQVKSKLAQVTSEELGNSSLNQKLQSDIAELSK